jgi:hypothetical protein
LHPSALNKNCTQGAFVGSHADALNAHFYKTFFSLFVPFLPSRPRVRQHTNSADKLADDHDRTAASIRLTLGARELPHSAPLGSTSL